jgi:hypothetical protein
MEKFENISPSNTGRSGPDGGFDPLPDPLIALADAAFHQAAVKLIRRAKQNGTPLIVWDQGRVRAVPPDELPDLEAGPGSGSDTGATPGSTTPVAD